MARGDKNKRGTSGRGSRDQSNQAFKKNDNHQKKATPNKRQTGGWRSDPQDQSLVSEIDRSARSRTEEQTRSLNTNERRFNLLVDSVPYLVSAKPFRFNGEVRYRVSVNGNSEHVFTWDSSLGQLRAIDDDASTLPDNVEEAISEKLQSKA
jgi:hypothetical protein